MPRSTSDSNIWASSLLPVMRRGVVEKNGDGEGGRRDGGGGSDDWWGGGRFISSFSPQSPPSPVHLPLPSFLFSCLLLYQPASILPSVLPDGDAPQKRGDWA